MLNIKHIQFGGGGNSLGLKELRPDVSYIYRAVMRTSVCIAALFACVGSGAMVYFVGFHLNTL